MPGIIPLNLGLKSWLKKLFFLVTGKLIHQIEETYEWKKVLDVSGKFGPIEGDESQFKSEQEFTFDELIERVMSISVIQVKSDSEKELVKERIKLIWNKYNEKNKLIIPYTVQIYWGERK